MKKILLTVATAVALCACNERISVDSPVEYGSIAAAISNNPEVVTVRSFTLLEQEEANKYYLTVYNSSDNSVAWARNTVADYGGSQTFAVGTYTLEAENCSAQEAEAANENVGQARYYGKTEGVEVLANQEKEAEIKCAMVNSKVSVDWENSNIGTYYSDYSITVTVGAREYKFEAGDAEEVYFNIPESADMAYTIAGTFNNTVSQTHSGKLSSAIEAAKHYILKLTVKEGQGTIKPSIYVDVTCTSATETLYVDPYNPDKE